jgi:glycosyltransferase involved in cell wall biosynthesis
MVASKPYILYVITKGTFGGAQKYVYDLAVGLSGRGVRCAVAYGTQGKLVDMLEVAEVPTHPIQAMGRDVEISSDFKTVKELYALFRRERPDVVHLNSSKAGILGAVAARLAHVPTVIFTSHGWAFNEDRLSWQKVVFAVIYAIQIYLCTRTICVSHAVAKDMRWLPFVRKRLTVIHNGISPVIYKNRKLSRQKLWPQQAENIWLGMLAELHPTKRIEDVIDAIALLIPRYPKLRLIVLGEGEYRDVLQRHITKAYLDDIILLRGFVPDAPTYLQGFDYLALCSRTESLGYALLEAGMAGVPVIGTRVGGIPEIIEDGVSGLLVEPLSPVEIARALETILNNPQQASEYASKLHDHVSKEFSMPQMLAKTEAVYHQK